MMTYLRLGSICALHIEMCRAFTATPWFAMDGRNGEMIVDVSYCRIIYTPGRLIDPCRDKYFGEFKTNEKLRTGFSTPAARAAEN